MLNYKLVKEELTGKTRFRTKRAGIFRRELVVLQVQVKRHYESLAGNPHLMSHSDRFKTINFFRDAKVEDITENEDIRFN